jgi:hypothetical protein
MLQKTVGFLFCRDADRGLRLRVRGRKYVLCTGVGRRGRVSRWVIVPGLTGDEYELMNPDDSAYCGEACP